MTSAQPGGNPPPGNPPEGNRPGSNRPGDAETAPPEDASAFRLLPAIQSWTVPVGSVVVAPPAFATQRVFLPLEQDQIAAYDALTGKRAWVAKGHPMSMPAVGDGLLFLAEPNAVTALDQSSGATAWRLPLPEPLAAPLVWDNGWLIGATDSGSILALRATDGELIWRRELDVALHATPALAADRVYVPVEDNRLVALKVDTGETLWERRLDGAPNEMLALDDRIYIGSNDNFFYCIEADDGSVAWRWRTGGDVIGVPVVDEQRVYFVSLDNVLRGLDRRSGAQRWHRPLPSRPTRGPVRAGDLLLVSGLPAKIPAFAIKDGAPAGDLEAGGELIGAPYIVPFAGPLIQAVLVSRDLEEGTRLSAFRRKIEPDLRRLANLPNPIRIARPASSFPSLPNPIVIPPPPLRPRSN
ncbi:MAG: PQQ-binding-like beta-propeller repeat protein [Vicinamibacterales bacterium]